MSIMVRYDNERGVTEGMGVKADACTAIDR